MATKKRKDHKGRLLQEGESQRKNDLVYVYRWTNDLGKREYVYAGTLEELRKKEKEIQMHISMGVSWSGISLNEQIEIYLETKTNLANSTKENYFYYFRHVIEPSRLGKMKVTEIKKSDVLLFYRTLSKQGYSIGSLKILQKIIRPAFQLACDDNIIFKNPSDGCLNGYTDDPEKRYALTYAEESEFLQRIKLSPHTQKYYPMYAVFLLTGLRMGELIGLTWDNVDMKKKEICIDHQVLYRTYQGKVQFYATKPKTKAGNRTIPMSNEVHHLLSEQRKNCLFSKKAENFEIDGYSNFVFISSSGRCMNPQSIRKSINRIVKMNDHREVQLPPISPHIFRHTAVCRLAESGCDIKVLQYLMGHVDLRTTMRVYNHVDMERIKREMDRLKCVE